MSDERLEIYHRLGNLETEGARMDERLKAIEANHQDIKKGLRAVESKVGSLFIKISAVFIVCCLFIGGALGILVKHVLPHN